MRKEWRFQSINAQRCAQALVQKTLIGETIPEMVYAKMREGFDGEEIVAIEAYYALHVAANSRSVRGCDYMTVEEMNEATEILV